MFTSKSLVAVSATLGIQMGLWFLGTATSISGMMLCLLANWLAFLPGEIHLVIRTTTTSKANATALIALEVFKAMIMPFVWFANMYVVSLLDQ